MSDTVIKVENLSKQYRLGQIGTGSLAHDLNRLWHKMRGKDDPYLQIGEVNDRTTVGNSQYVWSLKDIDFEIKQGDAVGVIGRNGAGKSTLLKVLSRVTAPTTGSVKVKGRIASLLEVGTGFHPELTGRENIFLNGAILGMQKKEIQRKFDEIVDFSGVERYIDTPVKRYSSGMYVRLAFAVAAHLDSEILIVDEVLAVGDAEFQRKCLGKMNDVSKGEGRTILFVSHNMGAISKLCRSGIFLKHGTVIKTGSIDGVIKDYLNEGSSSSYYTASEDELNPIQFLEAAIQNKEGNCISEFDHAEDIYLSFKVKNTSSKSGVRCNLALWDSMEQLIFVDRININPFSGYQQFTAMLPGKRLVPSSFKISLTMDIPSVELIDSLPEYLHFNIVDTGSESGRYNDTANGIIVPDVKWL